VFWLDIGAEATSLEELVAQVNALARVAEEVDARLAGAGAGGLDGAVAMYARLRAVFDGVSSADLERMAGRVAAIQAELEEVARRLAALRNIKIGLEHLEPEGDS
jgi:prefoldin subunit 5